MFNHHTCSQPTFKISRGGPTGSRPSSAARAVAVAPSIVDWVIAREERTTLNVNVPARPIAEVRGARWAAIDAFGHFSVATKAAGGTVLDLDVRDRRSGTEPGSDTRLCLDGFVTLTLLTPVVAEPAPDLDPAEVVRW
ncbi:hypothetical protein FTX61_04915 [Nitriliruptoraceae bacterium ZYF776]|nr:hypothetical protein [Profundirhabdus halotolerans]